MRSQISQRGSDHTTSYMLFPWDDQFWKICCHSSCPGCVIGTTEKRGFPASYLAETFIIKLLAVRERHEFTQLFEDTEKVNYIPSYRALDKKREQDYEISGT